MLRVLGMFHVFCVPARFHSLGVHRFVMSHGVCSRGTTGVCLGPSGISFRDELDASLSGRRRGSRLSEA